MISALSYLLYCSFWNRITYRVKRLKQPKYLMAAIVGLLYFYWYFAHYLFFPSASRQVLNGTFSSNPLMLESLGALVLFIIILPGWLIPRERAALTFTEAEIAFLFPAPISRFGLIHFKLLRSQIRILFGVLVLTLLSRNFGGNALIYGAGLWLTLSTLNLHFLGSSFTRTMLLDRGISNALRRLVVLALVLTGATAVVIWAKQTMPELESPNLADFRSIGNYAQQVLNAGPALYLLYPFRLMVRPVLAPDAGAFFRAAAPALLLFALHYWWVFRSNVAFEEASLAASQKHAARIAAARSGGWHGTRTKAKKRRPPFKLTTTGPQATALLWKNLMSVGQSFASLMWIGIAIVVAMFFFAAGKGARGEDLFVALSFVTAVLLIWSVLIGPQILRQDLRRDIELADVLKSYPLRGWQIVLGELLAPVVILSVAQWLLLMLGFSCLLHSRGTWGLPLVLTCTLGMALLLPLLDLILLLIPNGAVLLFPSWIQTGKDSPRGIEATGQRLIFMLGQLLVFTLAIIPAVAVFALVFFCINLLLGQVIAIATAALAAAIVLTVEAGLGIRLLGKLFERFDLSKELNH